jgi:glycosyltransferase involved in cell wall biosynthesis
MIPLRDAMVHAASNVITCSQTVRGRLGRLQEGRTHVIPNGIDLAQFALADRVKEVEKNYILYLGRLNKLKGVDLLIEALPRVYDRAGTIPVYIAGTGPESEMLRDLVKKREVDKTVSFLGFVEGKRKASLIRNAGVVVLPSRFENSPLTVLEAMACGRPVVAARVGGIPELVIEGSTGLLFEADNTVQLADRIVTVLQNPDIRRKLGSEAHRRARAHSWAIVAKRVREVYQASLRQGG